MKPITFPLFGPVALVLAAVLANTAHGGEAAGSDAYAKAMRASVFVVANAENRWAKGGSGFLIDRARKLLVTNNHVISGTTAVWVYFARYEAGVAVPDRKYYGRHDRPIFGRVVAADARRDLAIVQLDFVTPEAEALKLAPSGARAGDRVLLMGNPGNRRSLWVKNSATVRSARRQEIHYRGGEEVSADILDLAPKEPTGPGYSGGPVLNAKGEVVGIISGQAHFGAKTLCIDVAEMRDLVGLFEAHPRAAGLLLPRSADDFLSRGRYFEKKQRYESAAVDFTEALRLQPSDAATYIRRGLCYLRTGHLVQGFFDLDKAVRLGTPPAHGKGQEVSPPPPANEQGESSKRP